jgi:hypothetical protein
MIAPGWEQEVKEVLKALRHEIPIEPLYEG